MSILHVRMNILQVKMIEVTELQPLLLGGSVTASARTHTGRSRTWDWEAVRSEAASRLEPLLLGGGITTGAGTLAQDGAETRAQLELGLVAGALQIDAACARAGGSVRTS